MKIDIIGRGNVGTHLFKALNDFAAVKIVNPRTLEYIRSDSDLYLISVTDEATSSVAKKVSKLISQNSVVAHTSGSLPLSIMENFHNNIGVFYPMQTFSTNIKLDYSSIPIFLESNNDYTAEILNKTASLFSKKIQFIDSVKRKKLHIASVFSCNFVNHLWKLSEDFLKSNGLSFSYLLPLIIETTNKILETSPNITQTGPAKRHDNLIIQDHLNILKDNEDLYNIYKILSDSIMKNH